MGGDPVNFFIVAFLSALLFGLGLGLSEMTLPSKVIGFLDVTGNWDPSLAFVMIGAIAVHATAYRLIRKRPSPILAPEFQIPGKRQIDFNLVAGAFIFGTGWGLGGFCPGPAIVASVSGAPAAIVFLAALIVGTVAGKKFLQLSTGTTGRGGLASMRIFHRRVPAGNQSGGK
jgi:uncharacterized membrane protein YedE/YeeE